MKYFRYQLYFFTILCGFYLLFLYLTFLGQDFNAYDKQFKLFSEYTKQRDQQISRLFVKEPFPNYEGKIQVVRSSLEPVIAQIREALSKGDFKSLRAIQLPMEKATGVFIGTEKKFRLKLGQEFHSQFGKKWYQRFFLSRRHGGRYFSATMERIYPYPIELEEFEKTRSTFQVIYKNSSFIYRYYGLENGHPYLILVNLNQLSYQDLVSQVMDSLLKENPALVHSDSQDVLYWGGDKVLVDSKSKPGLHFRPIRVSFLEAISSLLLLHGVFIALLLFLYVQGGFRLLVVGFELRLVLFLLSLFILLNLASQKLWRFPTGLEERQGSSNQGSIVRLEATVKKDFQDYIEKRDGLENEEFVIVSWDSKNELLMNGRDLAPHEEHLFYEIANELNKRMLFPDSEPSLRQLRENRLGYKLPELPSPLVKTAMGRALPKIFERLGPLSQGSDVSLDLLNTRIHLRLDSLEGRQTLKVLFEKSLRNRLFSQLLSKLVQASIVVYDRSSGELVATDLELDATQTRLLYNQLLTNTRGQVKLSRRQNLIMTLSGSDFFPELVYIHEPPKIDSAEEKDAFEPVLRALLFLLLSTLFVQLFKKWLRYPLEPSMRVLRRLRDHLPSLPLLKHPFAKGLHLHNQLFQALFQYQMEVNQREAFFYQLPETLERLLKTEDGRFMRSYASYGCCLNIEFLKASQFQVNLQKVMERLQSCNERYNSVFFEVDKSTLRLLLFPKTSLNYIQNSLQIGLEIAETFADLHLLISVDLGNCELGFKNKQDILFLEADQTIFGFHNRLSDYSPQRGVFVSSLVHEELQDMYEFQAVEDHFQVILNTHRKK